MCLDNLAQVHLLNVMEDTHNHKLLFTGILSSWFGNGGDGNGGDEL